MPASGLPIWALSWILNAWSAGLPIEEREAFINLGVADLMRDPILMLQEPFVQKVPDAVNDQLACLNVLRARKK